MALACMHAYMEARGWHQASSFTILCFLYWSENSHLNPDLVNPARLASSRSWGSFVSVLLTLGLQVGYYKSYQAPAWLLKIWPPASAFPTNPSFQPSVCLSLIWPQVAANLPLSTAFVVSNKFWYIGSPFWFISRNVWTSFLISFLLLGCSKIAYFSAVEMAQKLRGLTAPPVVASSSPITHMVGNYHLYLCFQRNPQLSGLHRYCMLACDVWTYMWGKDM